MASIQKRPDGRWRARYDDPDGRERSRHFRRRVDAERWLSGVQADITRGVYLDPGGAKTKFGEYALEWQRIQVHRPSTAMLVDAHLRNHILPFLGERPLGSVRPTEIQAWVKTRSELLAPATVEVVYRFVAAIFLAAVKDRLIPVSPCVGIRLPKITPRRVVPLAAESVAGLIEAVDQRYRALVVLAAGTGLRQGEAFGVTLDRVDFLRRTLTVDRQLVLVSGPPQLGPPKTAASHRTVPLPEVVVDALAEHLASYPTAGGGFLFTDANGGPLRRNRFNEKVWHPAIKAVGLPKGTGFHDLRHFYASLLIRHGESVKVVQARLGHATAAETLDTYGHLWPDSDDRTRQAVDLILRSSQADSRITAKSP